MACGRTPIVTSAAKARRSARLAALLALLLAAQPPLLAQARAANGDNPELRLPALGESASDDFSLNAEKRLGEQIMREIRRDPDYMDDPPLLDYVQSIWQPLLAAARERGDKGADKRVVQRRHPRERPHHLKGAADAEPAD